jgi:hypothetical protein
MVAGMDSVTSKSSSTSLMMTNNQLIYIKPTSSLPFFRELGISFENAQIVLQNLSMLVLDIVHSTRYVSLLVSNSLSTAFAIIYNPFPI